MRTCAEYEELISALLDGELSAEEQTEVEAHIAVCPQCGAMYDAFAAVSAVGIADVPENLHTDIMTRVGAAQKAAKTRTKIVRLRPMLTMAACLVVIVGTVFAFNRSFRMGNAKSTAPAAAPADPAPAAAEPRVYAGVDSNMTEIESLYAQDLAPAEPAAPMPAPADPAPSAPEAPADAVTTESETELRSVVLEVISVAENSIEARDFKAGGTLTVLLTEETEISNEVRSALGPGCTVTVMYDLLQAEDELQITAVKILFAE